MCAQYLIRTTNQEIQRALRPDSHSLLLGSGWEDPRREWNLRLRGFMKTEKAPVLVINQGTLELRMMNFSLCPSWSKDFPFRFSTYNARMDRPDPQSPTRTQKIYSVPTWRDAFRKAQTCLVPMNSAIESSYFGTHAGNMIRFSLPSVALFLAAGIWDSWMDSSTGEVQEGFALLTDDPDPFFFAAGHDRSLLPLQDNVNLQWLSSQKLTTEQRFDLVRSSRSKKVWTVETERALAKGWEKKAPSSEEISQIKVWQPS